MVVNIRSNTTKKLQHEDAVFAKRYIFSKYNNVIPPFGVVLPVYPPDSPRARGARRGRADI